MDSHIPQDLLHISDPHRESESLERIDKAESNLVAGRDTGEIAVGDDEGASGDEGEGDLNDNHEITSTGITNVGVNRYRASRSAVNIVGITNANWRSSGCQLCKTS
jgi:hypothetical protein